MRSRLPAPPEGFAWRLYKNVVFLKPVAWNEREKAGSSAGIPYTIYATSPEAFSDEKQFEMGMTVQIVTDFVKTRGIGSEKMAAAYLKQFIDSRRKEDILLFDQKTTGETTQFVFRYKYAPAGLKPIIVHKFIIGKDAADSLHVFTFESPEATWEEDFARFGTPILRQLIILPNLSPK